MAGLSLPCKRGETRAAVFGEASPVDGEHSLVGQWLSANGPGRRMVPEELRACPGRPHNKSMKDTGGCFNGCEPHTILGSSAPFPRIEDMRFFHLTKKKEKKIIKI